MKNTYTKFLKLIILTFFLTNIFCISLFAKEKPFMLRSVRSLGMGNAFTALSNDHSAFFYNPAGVTQQKFFKITIAEIRATVSEDMLDFTRWFFDNKKDLEDFDELSSDKKEKLLRKITDEVSHFNNNVAISAPNFNFIVPLGKLYIGAGVFDEARAKIKMHSGLAVPSVDFIANVDVAGMFLMAYKFSDKFSAGVNTKLLARGHIEENRMSIIEFENYEPVIQPGLGIGADVGITYNLLNNLKLGFSANDIGGTKIKYNKVDEKQSDNEKHHKHLPERTEKIETRYNLGVAYMPFYILGLKNIVLTSDIRDITDEDDNGKIEDNGELFKKLHFGAEVDLKLLALRAGLNSGYPSFGLGFYLGFLRFDYAYYTDELGKYPGDNPETNHTASVSLRF